MPMKPYREDGGASFANWHRVRLEKLTSLSGPIPATLWADELDLVILYRYAETLLKNDAVRRYLVKYHRNDVHHLERLLLDFIKPVPSEQIIGDKNASREGNLTALGRELGVSRQELWGMLKKRRGLIPTHNRRLQRLKTRLRPKGSI